MHLEKKEPLISFLDRVIKLLEKALYWLALISPIGAFAHIALAAGTVHFEDLNKLIRSVCNEVCDESLEPFFLTTTEQAKGH